MTEPALSMQLGLEHGLLDIWVTGASFEGYPDVDDTHAMQAVNHQLISIRAQNYVDGDVTIEIYTEHVPNELIKELTKLGEAKLSATDGKVAIGDWLSESYEELELEPGTLRAEVLADTPFEAERVVILIHRS